MRNVLLILGSCLIVGILCQACATIHNPQDLMSSLRNDAEKYWNMRGQAKYEETYRMEKQEGLPAFEKYRNALASSNKNINVTSRVIKDVRIDGDNGLVDLEVTYLLTNIPKPLKDIIQDRWVFQDGKWRHVL